MADLNINEVIKDGEVLLSTRGTTVAPENLASGETAIDHEGNMIVGMMPTVDISDLYRVPDDEGTPANEDYIPFNDVSDEEEPTKKVSYEDIKEDILKDTYQTSGLYSSLIQTNDDLNNYTTAGTYDCKSSSITQTLSNCPVVEAFKMMVDVESNPNILTQTITVIHDKNAMPWRRSRDNSLVWGDWKQFATSVDVDVLQQQINDIVNYYSAKNMIPVSNIHFDGLYHNGITYSVDINNIVTANGTATAESRFYFIDTNTKEKLVENGETYTLSGGETNNTCQVELALFKNGAWISGMVWRTEGGKKTFTIPSDVDFDTATVYLRINSNTTVTNKKFYPVLCLGSLIDITYTSHAFSNQEISNNLITLVNRDSLPKNDNLNNYYKAGVYIIDGENVASSITNMPESNSGKLVVIQPVKKQMYATQIFIRYTGNVYYSRSTQDSGATWTSWKKLASTDDISPSTMGNGYAVTTVSGSTITATITGYKLRAGAIVALMFNSFIKVACTLNISNTGAKNIQMITGGNPSEGTPLPIGVNTFIYDGTYYRFLSNNMSPYISTQSYVASTSGNIILNWGFANDSVQLKHYISTGRLVYNYYKNGAWREDKQILDITGQQTLERWLGLKSPANTRTIASGAHNLAVQDTIPNILGELRYSNGAWGSFNLGTAYTYRDLIVPTGWYNYFYMPHRVGGENWTTPTNWDTDNVNFGTLMLFGMNNDNGIYRIRWSSSAIVLVERLDSMAVSVTKTGKSILPSWCYSTNVREIEGVTYTFNPQTCEITANGTATSDSWCVLYGGDENMYSRLQRGSYVLSGCASGGSINTYFVALYVTGNDWKDYGNGVSFTIPNEAKLTKNYAIVVKKNATVSNLVFKPMLRPAWTSAEFEPCEDIHKGNCYVGTCETAGGTKDKVAYVDGYFILRKGVRVAIKFTNSNTYSSSTSNPVTLNVNNTGAKNIYAYNTHSGAGLTGTNNFVYGIANQYNYFIYDGTYWCYDGHGGDYDTTNFLRNDASSTMTASSPYLVLKASNVDAKQANNGVSATAYSSYALSDKNNYALSRLESIAETNGNTRTYLQVGNYKTSTSSTFNMGITLYANKSGDMWYNFSNPYNASSALGFGYGTCDTAESTVAKVVTLSRYIIAQNGYVTVKFTNAVPANSTMNINSQGAKNIYYHGSAITAGRIRAGDYATFIFDGTNYNLIGVDRETERILTASLSANATTVTFTGLPTSGNQMYDIYTDKPNLTYTNIDNSTSGQITVTFPAQTTATNVYLKVSDL